MNPENNMGNSFQNNEMNSSSLGSIADNSVNPVQEPVNNTLNDLSALGVESLQNNVTMQPQQIEQPVQDFSQPINNEAESLGNAINNYEPAQPVGQGLADVLHQTQSININPQPYEAPVQNLAAEQPITEPTLTPDYNSAVNQDMSQLNQNVQPAVESNINSEPMVNNEASVSQPSGPTMPIPDAMPDLGYQSAVSTPVDYATPMSNFDEIGVTPELDPKAKNKSKGAGKTLVFILLMLAILGLGAGSYYLINVKKIFDKSSVETKNLTLEQGATLPDDINEYATFKNMSASNCVHDISEVKTDKIGTYNYVIKCGKNEYKGTVTIKDTKAPSVKLKAFVTKVNESSSVTADALIASCSEENCTYDIVDKDGIAALVTEKGIKSVKLAVSDASGNTANVNAPIIVIDGGLHFGLVAQKQITSTEEYTVTEKNVVLYSDLSYLAYTVYEIKFTDETVYSTYTKQNSDSANVTIGDYSGIGVFDNTENKISLVSSNVSNLIQGNYQYDRQALQTVEYDVTVFASDHIDVLNY